MEGIIEVLDEFYSAKLGSRCGPGNERSRFQGILGQRLVVRGGSSRNLFNSSAIGGFLTIGGILVLGLRWVIGVLFRAVGGVAARRLSGKVQSGIKFGTSKDASRKLLPLRCCNHLRLNDGFRSFL